MVPDHELIRRVGTGAYGEVWFARNVIGAYRAIKVVYRNTFESHRPYEREFAGMKRFEPISRSHEGLVDVLQVGRNDEAGYFYYVMELADSVVNASVDPDQYAPKTLKSESSGRRSLPLDECLRIGVSLAAALEHLHREGLVHRDIKPSNGVPREAKLVAKRPVGGGYGSHLDILHLTLSRASAMTSSMARPLRIEIAGGRYHVTARGNERRDIFRDERDRRHFLELLAQLPERFGTVVHAYVLMPNHFHLLLETPETNLSRTGQWLNVSYSVWFNRRHQRSGHLFQGRFAAILIEDDAGFQEVGRYMHLNPVRVKGLGLDKRQRAAGKTGLSAAPAAEVVAERLAALRAWKWSSYRAYAGHVTPPTWLTCDRLGAMCGGKTAKERQAALRAYTEHAVREGLPERPWDRLIGGLVLGTQAFAEGLRGKLDGNHREQPALRRLTGGVAWEAIVRALESVKGERWEQFRDRHGDWGRDAALWLGRRQGRLTLRQLAEHMGGLDYTAAGAAARRFGRRLAQDRKLACIIAGLEAQLANVEM